MCVYLCVYAKSVSMLKRQNKFRKLKVLFIKITTIITRNKVIIILALSIQLKKKNYGKKITTTTTKYKQREIFDLLYKVSV